MIDDATDWTQARFSAGETVEGRFDLPARWLSKHHHPEALDSDQNRIFESLSKSRKTQGKTPFSRAPGEPGIERILAGSPPAKGRVERPFGTLQDRWIKALVWRG